MTDIPKRPVSRPTAYDETDWLYLHERTVAKMAVEAPKDAITKQRASRLYSATDEMEDALAKIEASGWKP